MNTLFLSAALLLGAATAASSPSSTDDHRALTVINRMADNIGALHSCAFRLNVSRDEWNPDAGMLVHDSHEVCLVGPDKMLVNTTGDAGHRGFWYDGKEACSNWYGENNYGRVAAPTTIIAMIQRVRCGSSPCSCGRQDRRSRRTSYGVLPPCAPCGRARL